MGKGQSPTPNELKFVYELLAEGYSDADILAKYDELQRHGKLGSLPYRQDIRFIRQRRKEFDTAKLILKESLGLQLDPYLIKAREEHLDGIRSLIEQWLKALPEWVPLPGTTGSTIFTFNSLPFEINQLKHTQLYECLYEHLKDETLWQRYCAWESKYAQYVAYCHRLSQDIRYQKEAFSKKAEICKDFERPLLSQISMKMQPNTLEMTFESRDKDLICLHWPHDLPDEAIGVELEEDLILRAESPESFSSEYQKIGSSLLSSQLVNDMVELYTDLTKVHEDIRKRLHEILVRCDYIHNKCRLCPS